MANHDETSFGTVTVGTENFILHPSVMSPSGFTSAQYIRRRSYKQGTSTPKQQLYQHFINHGYLPVTPYVRVVDEIESLTLGSLKSTWGPRPANYDASPGGSTFTAQTDFRILNWLDLTYPVKTPLNDPVYVALRAQAIAKANSNVRENAGMFETFCELRKTQRMFLSAASTVVRTARLVRKGRFAAAARELGVPTPSRVGRKRSFSSNWLEYRYGWLPLYSSLFTAAKATYQFYHNRSFVKFAYGVAKAPLTLERSTRITLTQLDSAIHSVVDNHGYVMSPWSYNAWIGSSWDVLRSYDRTLAVQVGYIYRITNPNLSYATDLGLTDPISVAWELVPLSFVADWFLNVGDCLEQVGAFTGKQFLSGNITYMERGKAYVRSANFSSANAPNDISLTGFTPASARRSFAYMERQVLTSQPLFGLHSENGLNGKRIVDAVSLLRQAFR